MRLFTTNSRPPVALSAQPPLVQGQAVAVFLVQNERSQGGILAVSGVFSVVGHARRAGRAALLTSRRFDAAVAR